MDLEILKEKITSYLDGIGAEYRAETSSDNDGEFLKVKTYISFNLNKIEFVYYFTFEIGDGGLLRIDVHFDEDSKFVLPRNEKNDKLMFEFNEKSSIFTASISSNNGINKDIFYLHFDGIIEGESEVLDAIKAGMDELCDEDLMQLEWLIYKRCE